MAPRIGTKYASRLGINLYPQMRQCGGAMGTSPFEGVARMVDAIEKDSRVRPRPSKLFLTINRVRPS